MAEILFGSFVAFWTTLVVVAIPLAGEKHDFSKVTVFTMCVISTLGATLAAYLSLKPEPVAALIISVVAFEIGLFAARNYYPRAKRLRSASSLQ